MRILARPRTKGGRAVADGLGQVTAALLYGFSMRSDNVATSERPQLERVLDDDIQPVDIIAALAAVGAMGDMGQLQRQVLGRARLHDVVQVQVALPTASASALLQSVSTII